MAKNYSFQSCQQFNPDNNTSPQVICEDNQEHALPIENDDELILILENIDEEAQKSEFAGKLKTKLLMDFDNAKNDLFEKEACLRIYANSKRWSIPESLARNPIALDSNKLPECEIYTKSVVTLLKDSWPKLRRSMAISSSNLWAVPRQNPGQIPNSSAAKEMSNDIILGEGAFNDDLKFYIDKKVKPDGVCAPFQNCRNRPKLTLNSSEQRMAINEFYASTIKADQAYLAGNIGRHPEDIFKADKFMVRGYENVIDSGEISRNHDSSFYALCTGIHEEINRLPSAEEKQLRLQEITETQNGKTCVVEPEQYYLIPYSNSPRSVRSANFKQSRNANMVSGLAADHKTLVKSAIEIEPALAFLDLGDINEISPTQQDQRIIEEYLLAQNKNLAEIDKKRNRILDMDEEDILKMMTMPGLTDGILKLQKPLKKNQCDIAQSLVDEVKDDEFWRDIAFGAVSIVGCGALGVATLGTAAVACGVITGSAITGEMIYRDGVQLSRANLLYEIDSIPESDLKSAQVQMSISVLSMPVGAVLGAGIIKGAGAVSRRVANSSAGQAAGRRLTELKNKINLGPFRNSQGLLDDISSLQSSLVSKRLPADQKAKITSQIISKKEKLFKKLKLEGFFSQNNSNDGFTREIYVMLNRGDQADLDMLQKLGELSPGEQRAIVSSFEGLSGMRRAFDQSYEGFSVESLVDLEGKLYPANFLRLITKDAKEGDNIADTAKALENKVYEAVLPFIRNKQNINEAELDRLLLIANSSNGINLENLDDPVVNYIKDLGRINKPYFNESLELLTTAEKTKITQLRSLYNSTREREQRKLFDENQASIRQHFEEVLVDNPNDAEARLALSMSASDLYAARFTGSVDEMARGAAFKNDAIYQQNRNLWWRESAMIPSTNSRSPLLGLYGNKATRKIFWPKNMTSAQDSPTNAAMFDLDMTDMRASINYAPNEQGQMLEESMEIIAKNRDTGEFEPFFYVKKGSAWIQSKTFQGKPVRDACIKCHSSKSKPNVFIPLPKSAARSPESLVKAGYTQDEANAFVEAFKGMHD